MWGPYKPKLFALSKKCGQPAVHAYRGASQGARFGFLDFNFYFTGPCVRASSAQRCWEQQFEEKKEGNY